MAKLLMITGDRALAEGKHGAFYNTLEELHKHWDRIDIITPRVSNPDSKIKNLFGNIFIHSSNMPLILQPWFILKKGLEIYKEQSFNLMTVHEYPPFYNGIGARFLWQKIKVPYILEIHHIIGYPRAANSKEEIYKNFTKMFISWDSQRAKAVRVVNQNQVPEFLTGAGVPKEKIIYIPSIYLDLNIFKPLYSPKEYDLIFVARLEVNKGARLFIEATKKANLRSLIVGEGSLKNELKNLAARLQADTTFYGWAQDPNELAGLINKSKVLVMVSYNEGGPRVVPEALACGVPVLATPVGIVPDLLKNGRGGELISWEADDIANKAKSLLGDASRYWQYSQSGPEITSGFERASAVLRYSEALKKIINL